MTVRRYDNNPDQREVATSKPPPADDRLDSWKAIAAHLGRTVRTVQRWERSCGLPVHRHLHASSSSLYAYRSELDGWWNARGPEIDLAGTAPAPRPNPEPSLLVLPFSDLTGDRASRHLCEGLAEELITAIAKTGQIRIPSWSAVSASVRNGATLDDLVRAFAPDLVVEGSIRLADGRLRILIRVVAQRDGAIVAAESADTSPDTVLNVEDQLVRLVLRACGLRNDSATLVRPHSATPDAHDLYLMSRHYWNERSIAALEKSVTYAEQALALDPSYALAAAGLALSSATLASYPAAPPRDDMERARRAARAALAIDNSLSEAHTALGFVQLAYDWDWAGAEASLRRATDCDPLNAGARQWYALHQLVTGRGEEALRLCEEAEEIDPGLPILKCHTVWILYFLQRFDEATRRGEAVVRRYPKFWRAHFNLGCCYLATGRLAEAFHAAQTAAELGRSLLTTTAFLAACEFAGCAERASIVRRELVSSGQYLSGYWMGVAAVGSGDLDDALKWLRQGHAAREWYWILAAHEPLLDGIRSSDEFRALLEKVGPS